MLAGQAAVEAGAGTFVPYVGIRLTRDPRHKGHNDAELALA
jgi:hypothetical protein